MNVDKTKYMVMSRNQNAGQSHCMKIYNSSFEMVEEFKFLGTTLSNKNSLQEEDHSTLQSGNVCCHSVKNLLSSSLLSKTTKIKVQQNCNFVYCFYGYENWSLTLKEESMLNVFPRKVLRRTFGPKRDEVTRE